MVAGYIQLKDLKVYLLALNLSNECWKIYERLNWQERKVLGDQFITAVDSVGANIAEGYGRFHYLDRIKFYYNSRGSLLEVKHWVLLLKNRNKITRIEFEGLVKELNSIHFQLNSFIRSCYPKK
jgi:four helix bundle protein